MAPRATHPRRNVLRVPLTDAERDDVETWADASGLSMAEVVRAAMWPTRAADVSHTAYQLVAEAVRR